MQQVSSTLDVFHSAAAAVSRPRAALQEQGSIVPARWRAEPALLGQLPWT